MRGNLVGIPMSIISRHILCCLLHPSLEVCSLLSHQTVPAPLGIREQNPNLSWHCEFMHIVASSQAGTGCIIMCRGFIL